MIDQNIKNVIIIGSGPAGLTAALYAARAELKPLLFAGLTWGGQLMLTSEVENYPGFPEGLMGPELMDKMRKQAERFGTEVLDEDVIAADFSAKGGSASGGKKLQYFTVKTEKAEYKAKTIIIATGADANWLNLPNEQRLRGHGVSACATCLPVGSNIMANNSLKPINSLQQGQYVLTHRGTYRPVAGSGSRHYKGNLVKIIPRYFREEPTLLTPEHPVLVTQLRRGIGVNYWKQDWGIREWKLAGELTTQDILLYPVVQETKDVEYISIAKILGLSTDGNGLVYYPYETKTSRRIPDKVPVNKDFMRLAGYFLAEGCITGRGINFYFGPGDESYVEDVQSIMENLFAYQVRVKKEDSVFRIECYAGIIRDLFQHLFGKYSYGKSLPHWTTLLPAEKQAEVIKGYWRGDGGTKKLGFILVTNSPQLVAQFKIILLRLGIIPQILKQSKEQLNKTKNVFEGRAITFKHDRYQLMLGGQWLKRVSEILDEDHDLLYSRTRTNEHAWIKEGYAYLPIAELTHQPYDGDVYNIAVEEENTYVTAGVTVHNCDGFFFKGKEVAVVGGGDSAMEEALFLTKFATKVTIIHRRDEFRASKIMLRRAQANPKIAFLANLQVIDVLGADKVEGVKVKDAKTGQESSIAVEGLFLAIGHSPNTKIFAQAGVEMDQKGYIAVKNHTRTNIEGVFVAGDVNDPRYRQAVTAAGMGCMAAMDVEKYLAERE